MPASDDRQVLTRQQFTDLLKDGYSQTPEKIGYIMESLENCAQRGDHLGLHTEDDYRFHAELLEDGNVLLYVGEWYEI